MPTSETQKTTSQGLLAAFLGVGIFSSSMFSYAVIVISAIPVAEILSIIHIS